MVVRTDRNSKMLMWSVWEDHFQPETVLHFHNLAGIDALRRWCFTRGSELLWSRRSSPFMETMSSIFLTNFREDRSRIGPGRCSGGRSLQQQSLEVTPLTGSEALDSLRHTKLLAESQRSAELAEQPHNHSNLPGVANQTQTGVLVGLPVLFFLWHTRSSIAQGEAHENFSLCDTWSSPSAFPVNETCPITILIRWKQMLVVSPSL